MAAIVVDIKRIVMEILICAIIGSILALIGLVIGALLTANIPLEFAHGGGYEVGGFIGALLGMGLGSFLGVWLLEKKNSSFNGRLLFFHITISIFGALILLKVFTDVFQFYNGGLIILTIPIVTAIISTHRK